MADSVALSYRLFGEDVSASSALQGVATEAGKTGKKIGDGIDEGSSHLERLGERADGSEQRIMGLKDSVDGLSTIMQGPGEQGIAAYLQGWADLSSGIANFVVPALMKVIPATVKNAVATAWSTTTQMAASAASKAWAAAQWLLNAALTANPIGLIILAIVAFVGIIVLAYNKVGWFRDLVNRAWAGIKVAIGAVVQWFQQTAWPIIQTVIGYIVGYYKMLWTVFSTVVGWIVTKGGALLGFFTELPGKISAAVTGLWDGLKTSFRSAVNWIIDHWNGLQLRLGGQHISLPFGQSFDIPSITLDTPNIPRLAAGGIVAHRPGGVLAILGEGRYDEQVTPLDGRSGGFVMNVYVQGDTDPAGAARRIVQIINEARDNGTLRWA
jgi:hypothetical protein